MASEEKRILKERYDILKSIYRKLKEEIKLASFNSESYYQLALEMTGIECELQSLQLALKSSNFRECYLDYIIAKIFLGDNSLKR